MICEAFDAAMSDTMRRCWRAVDKVPLWWAWSALLSNEVQQRCFEDGGFAGPLPVFQRLVAWGDDVFVQEMLPGIHEAMDELR